MQNLELNMASEKQSENLKVPGKAYVFPVHDLKERGKNTKKKL